MRSLLEPFFLGQKERYQVDTSGGVEGLATEVDVVRAVTSTGLEFKPDRRVSVGSGYVIVNEE